MSPRAQKCHHFRLRRPSARLGVFVIWSSALHCQGGYPLPPTPCDDWCFATQRAGCDEDYPADCVSECERDAGGREPSCEGSWLRLSDCYRDAAATDFVCIDGVSQPRAICVEERSELAGCVSPLSGSCVASCVREVAACDQPDRDCEAECETSTPGCEAEDRALYECRLTQPVDCRGSEAADPPCLEQALQLLACAGYTAPESESESESESTP